MCPSGRHTMNTQAVTYEFGPFRLSVVDRQLFQDDTPIPLTPKVFDTLVVLVEEAGRLVQKDEFLSRIWPDTVVEEVGLAHNISQLRRVLGDGRDEPQFIQTVPKRGYRFVAPVTIVPPAPEQPRTRVVVGVLPFDNFTGDAEREYLADGLMEELIVSLGQIDSARIAVLGRTSMMRQKGRAGSIADIGRQLKATHVIEGSMRIEGGRIRVTAKLIRVVDQVAAWSASFDVEPVSVLAFQRELSAVIADQVRIRLTPECLDGLSRRQTRDADAYDLYLRGRYFWNQLTPATNARAIEYFERALALDSDYALAWAGIAYAVLGGSMNSDMAPAVLLARAEGAAARAVQADSALADAHAAVGYVRFLLEWNWVGAEASLRRAVALDTSCGVGVRMLGHLLSQTARHDEARAVMSRLREIDPLYAMNHAMSAQVAFQARDYTEAIEHARRAIVIDPEFWIGYMELGQAYERLDKVDLALDALITAGRLSGGNSKAISLRAYVLARTGRTDEARDLLETLESVARVRYVPPAAFALVHAGFADREAVFEWLDKAAAVRDVHLMFLPVDAKWDEYRRDSRFDAVLARCGFTSPQTNTPV
jgi:DNA-binding winged helix-turn-helix (wHTH) protein/tetratricopeptide (TPR) repeat protein